MTLQLDRRTSVCTAIEKARRFLLAAQDANGAWRDFLLPAGLSDSWVTAYVAEALLTWAERDSECLNAARSAWAFLQGSETQRGGWSYNPRVPGDADSTLWGLRLAVALGEEGSPLAKRAFAFLDSHLRADGGLSTYATADPIRDYIGAPAMVPFNGWTQSHICVSAAGANLSRYAEAITPYLLTNQHADGYWPAYFWFDREYSTGEAVNALTKVLRAGGPRRSDIADSIGRAVSWLVRRVNALVAANIEVRPAFALACAAGCLAPHAQTDESRQAIALAGASLAEWQRDVGSWGPTARLRVPPPHEIIPSEDSPWTRWEGVRPGTAPIEDPLKRTFTNFSPDHRGLFGAAASLRALRHIARCYQT